ELHAVLATYPEIAERVTNDPRYQLVHGNHDFIAARALGAPEMFELEDRGTKLCFFHGHQLDPLTSSAAWLSRAAAWFGGMLEGIGFHVTPQDLMPARDAPLDKKRELFTQGALELGKKRGADIVITGHTHRAVRIEENGRLFMNSGTCV